MNIFDLTEKEAKEFLKGKLDKISREELMEELIECGLQLNEEVHIYDEASYYEKPELDWCDTDAIATWSSTKVTGWTSIKQKLSGKTDNSREIGEAA